MRELSAKDKAFLKERQKLLKQIFELATEPGDIVLDYHLGSGTTCAVAHKMGLRYIGCEQLDYGENDALVRLKRVISGDSTGISKTVNWQGGGSFVYCELAKLNQKYVDEIEDALDTETLQEIYKRIVNTGYISSKVNPAHIEDAADDFLKLSLVDQKRFLMELLDMNFLYVNYCDIDDEEYAVTDGDKAFTKCFYGEV